jgi:hypothetical protein
MGGAPGLPKEARVRSDPPFDHVQHLTQYLLEDPANQVLAEPGALYRELAAAGRINGNTVPHLEGAFAIVEAASSPQGPVTAAAVPYRWNRGVYVVAQQSPASVADLVDAECEAEILQTIGVVGMWRFARSSSLQSHVMTGDANVTICYLDRDPLEVSDVLGPIIAGRLDKAGEAAVLAGPFRSIQPWRWDLCEDASTRATA